MVTETLHLREPEIPSLSLVADDRICRLVLEDEHGSEHTVQCRLEHLLWVARGVNYQAAGGSGYCTMRRVGDSVWFEFEIGSETKYCSVDLEEYRNAVEKLAKSQSLKFNASLM
jgi:hypothetical protein